MSSLKRMVHWIKEEYGFDSPLVLGAMLKVPRGKFIPGFEKPEAYSDRALAIGHGQTISQPYTVAFMTDLVLGSPKKKDDLKARRVLEIGTGSGYQAAVLAELVDQVYSIEVVKALTQEAKKRLKKLGYGNVQVKTGDGAKGWPEKAPFDAILITAGVEGQVPQALFDQLKEGGILVAPVGGQGKEKIMTRFSKKKGEIKKEKHGTFYFVPFKTKE